MSGAQLHSSSTLPPAAPVGSPIADMGGAGTQPGGHRGLFAALGSRTSGVIATHSVIDFFSFVIIAIMPALAAAHHLSGREQALLLAVGSICSGVIQPIVAWASDRLNTRFLGVAGFVLGVVAVSSLGLARSFEHLLLIQVLSSIGIGAYHPVAAAMVGHASGARRSLGLSAFFVGGMIGGIAGNAGAPSLFERYGYAMMPVLLAGGMAFAVLLAVALLGAPHRHDDAETHHNGLAPSERAARWRAVWILFAGNVLRFTVNMALVYLFVQWATAVRGDIADGTPIALDAAKRASVLNGQLQAAMQVGMGMAGLVAGWVLSTRHEKAALVWVPVVGAGGIAAFSLLGVHGATLTTVVLAGFLAIAAGAGFGGLIPLTMSLGQRLLPHRTSLASGLMLGGAWTFAAAGPMAAEAVQQHFGLGPAFVSTAAALALAGVLSLALPGHVIRSV